MSRVSIPENELNAFDLPSVCLITGATSGVVFKRVKFAWYPRWIVALILVNALIAAIVSQIMIKRVRGQLPFTNEGYRRWKIAQWVSPLSVFFGLLLGLAGIILLDSAPPVGLLLMLLAIAMPIALHFKLVRGRTLEVVEIREGRLVLKIPSESAARAISSHLVGGLESPEARVA